MPKSSLVNKFYVYGSQGSGDIVMSEQMALAFIY